MMFSKLAPSRPYIPRASLALACAAVVGMAMFVSVPARAQTDFSQVNITSERVSPSIAVLFGAGGNIAVFHGSEGTVLVDDQYAPLTPKIMQAIAELGATPVAWLINTHWHGDHSGGNENFGKAGAIIMAHEQVRQRMGDSFTFFGRPKPASPKEALPIVTWDSGIRLYLNDDIVDIHHVPRAHTDGDSIVHWKNANVIHMGDVFFHKVTLPFIDLQSGGSIHGLIEAVTHALDLADENTVIIPGHGPIATRSDLLAYRTMLAEITSAVATARAEGKSLAEIQAMQPAKAWDTNPEAFIKGDRFVEAVYQSLAKEEQRGEKAYRKHHRHTPKAPKVPRPNRSLDGDSKREVLRDSY